MRLLHNFLVLLILKIRALVFTIWVTIMYIPLTFTSAGFRLLLLDEDTFIERAEEKHYERLCKNVAFIRRYWKNEDK